MNTGSEELVVALATTLSVEAAEGETAGGDDTAGGEDTAGGVETAGGGDTAGGLDTAGADTEGTAGAVPDGTGTLKFWREAQTAGSSPCSPISNAFDLHLQSKKTYVTAAVSYDRRAELACGAVEAAWAACCIGWSAEVSTTRDRSSRGACALTGEDVGPDSELGAEDERSEEEGGSEELDHLAGGTE